MKIFAGRHPVIAMRMRGVSLIEVTIAILVLSIGALGLAGLQIVAKRGSHEALQRTVASSLAVDLMERMRANPNVLNEYVVTGVGSIVRTLPTQPTKNCLTSAGACTASELAIWDLWEWERALNGATAMRAGAAAGGLLNPIGCVSVTNRVVTIEIAWQGFQSLSTLAAGTGCGAGLYETDDVNRQLLQMTSYIGES